MATSNIDFANPILTTLYTDVLDYLRNNINAVGMMDYTGATNIPVGMIQWNDTTKIFEKWGGSTWGEIYTTFPAGFTMLAVQNSAPTGWARKTLSCSDNAMFCYAKTGNTNYGGSVNPQSTHDHNISSHTHNTTNHSHSIAVHTHTLNSHYHAMSHDHPAGDHTHAGGTLQVDAHYHKWLDSTSGGSSFNTLNGLIALSRNNLASGGLSIVNMNSSNYFTSHSSPSISTGVTATGTGDTDLSSISQTQGPNDNTTTAGGTTTTGSAGADTTSGSSESTTGSNTAPYYQEVIAIEKS